MVEAINHYAGLWLNWQWSMLWQTAVLVAVVAAIDRLVRKWVWPQLRYALWLLVLVKLVLPPMLTSPISVTSSVPVLAQNVIETSVEPASMATETLAASTLAVEKRALNAQPSAPVATESHTASTASVAAVVPALSWAACAMAVWLLGVVSLSIGLVVYLRRLAVEYAESCSEKVPEWFDDVLFQAAGEIGLGRAPRVVFSTKICSPAVFGLFRPVLLMPAEEVATMTPSVARHVLLHELAHIKRGDLLVHAVQMGLMILYWFNPLLWFIRKHVQNLRELCCDATVARLLGSESGAYRQTLLDTGRALLARPIDPGLGLLGLHENPGWLVVRLDWLQKGPWRRPWLSRTLIAAVMALMLCCVLPMASLRADVATADGYKVTLPNGAVIELVGLCNKNADRWWGPAGRALEEGLLDPDMPHGPPWMDCTKIFLRYENLPDGTVGNFWIDPGNGYWGTGIPALRHIKAKKNGLPVENLTWLEATVDEGTETTSANVRLAMGHWQDHITLPFKPRSWTSYSVPEVTVFEPYERDDQTRIPIVHTIRDRDVRIIAIDVNDVEHGSLTHGGTGSKDFHTTTAVFDMPLDDIATLRVQKRPYTRIEFKNVSMVPGRSQKSEVVMTEAQLLPEQNGPVDVTEVRKQSPQFLKVFQAGVKEYCKRNGWGDLPEQLWSIPFKLDDEIEVHPSYFTESVGYFGPDGFQSLRPEYFRLPLASKTPILYCKRLLEAEQGKGTNVLFGDGRVEWVTSEELNRLKAAGMPAPK